MAINNNVLQPYSPLGPDDEYNNNRAMADLMDDSLRTAEIDAFGNIPGRKTYSRNGILYYVGGGRVPAAVAAKLRAEARKRSAPKPVAKKAPARTGKKRRTASSSAGRSSSAVSPAPDLTQGAADLGSFGSPSTRNVNSIVDSIISDATKQYRWANEDARKQALSDMSATAGGALALDRINQAAAAGNQLFNEAIQRKTDQAQANEAEALARMRADLAATSQTGGAPMEYAAQDADMSGANAAEQSMNTQSNAAQAAYLTATRLANQQMAQESMRNTRSGYASEVAQNNRAIAEAKAQKARVRQEVESGIWDDYIKRKMAEAEWAQRGSSLQNDAVSRNQAAETVAMQKKEQAAGIRSENDKSRMSDYDLINGIIYGSAEKIKVPVGQDKNGKPIYEEQVLPAGKATTLAEVMVRLRMAGLNTPQWRRIATDAWNEQRNQIIRDNAVNTIGQIGSIF